MRNQIIPLHRGVAPIRPDHISRIVGDPDAVFAPRHDPVGDWGHSFRKAVEERNRHYAALRFIGGASVALWLTVFLVGYMVWQFCGRPGL